MPHNKKAKEIVKNRCNTQYYQIKSQAILHFYEVEVAFLLIRTTF